ncbi:hypothetical protein FA15DRAFT_661618, partial [Coprinopsis marcescibilis]
SSSRLTHRIMSSIVAVSGFAVTAKDFIQIMALFPAVKAIMSRFCQPQNATIVHAGAGYKIWRDSQPAKIQKSIEICLLRCAMPGGKPPSASTHCSGLLRQGRWCPMPPPPTAVKLDPTHCVYSVVTKQTQDGQNKLLQMLDFIKSQQGPTLRPERFKFAWKVQEFPKGTFYCRIDFIRVMIMIPAVRTIVANFCQPKSATLIHAASGYKYWRDAQPEKVKRLMPHICMMRLATSRAGKPPKETTHILFALRGVALENKDVKFDPSVPDHAAFSTETTRSRQAASNSRLYQIQSRTQAPARKAHLHLESSRAATRDVLPWIEMLYGGYKVSAEIMKRIARETPELRDIEVGSDDYYNYSLSASGEEFGTKDTCFLTNLAVNHRWDDQVLDPKHPHYKLLRSETAADRNKLDRFLRLLKQEGGPPLEAKDFEYSYTIGPHISYVRLSTARPTRLDSDILPRSSLRPEIAEDEKTPVAS